jgi:putative ATPase
MKAPLSEQLRPKTLEEVVGQPHLIGPTGFISQLIKNDRPLSIILWGPPGCGKTTLARLYAQAFSARLISFSAVFSGIADLRKVVKEVEDTPLLSARTILFVDEIHRFNKSQQDAFLPYLENGTFILIGATTENPSFALNDALLSRVRAITLNALDPKALQQILERYEAEHSPLPLSAEAREALLRYAQGDGRYLLNMIENIQHRSSDEPLSLEELKLLLQKRAALFDRAGEGHYNLISALHKAVRGSDPDAALYWFARILEGGEDPLFIARRIIRMAVEDVGLADPEALKLAIAARDAYQMLGTPEGELALAEAVIYLALAPKSNAIYTAYGAARECAKMTSHLPPPAIILNAPTKLMKELGYGKDYVYDHDTPQGFSGQNYFPDNLDRPSFYQPVERGFEREMTKRLDYFAKLRSNLR